MTDHQAGDETWADDQPTAREWVFLGLIMVASASIVIAGLWWAARWAYGVLG